MKLTDRRLYQARSFEDLVFRLSFRDEDNQTRRGALRESYFFAEGFVAPDTEKIWGVDISGRWDGRVNFRVTADYGAKFAVTKAIDGTVPTIYWKENNRNAYDAGLLNTTYGWLYPDRYVSCKAQAQAYWELIKGELLRLPPAVDFEWTKYNGQQANPNYTDLRKWLSEFVRISGVNPILYSAAGFINPLGALPADIQAMLSGDWVASYSGSKPLLPKGVSSWDIWQFSANGDALLLCPGNQGKRELDLNYMTEEFYARYKMADEPEPEEPGETMRYTVTLPTSSVALRPDHNTANNPIGYIPAATVLQTDAAPFIAPVQLSNTGGVYQLVGDTWASVSYTFNGVLRNGWVAIIHKGLNICTLTDNQPAPPAELPNRIGLTLDGTTIRWYVAE